MVETVVMFGDGRQMYDYLLLKAKPAELRQLFITYYGEIIYTLLL